MEKGREYSEQECRTPHTELTGSLSLNCQEQYPCILIAYAPKMSFTLPGLGGKTPRLLLAHTLSFT